MQFEISIALGRIVWNLPVGFLSILVSLPPDQVSQGVRKSKSLPLSSLGRSLAGLPPPVTSKYYRPGIHQSQSLCSFPAPLITEPLRNMQVLPAIPPQRKRSPSPTNLPNTTENDVARGTWCTFSILVTKKADLFSATLNLVYVCELENTMIQIMFIELFGLSAYFFMTIYSGWDSF